MITGFPSSPAPLATTPAPKRVRIKRTYSLYLLVVSDAHGATTICNILEVTAQRKPDLQGLLKIMESGA